MKLGFFENDFKISKIIIVNIKINGAKLSSKKYIKSNFFLQLILKESKRNFWTEEEDNTLKDFVRNNGATRWVKLSKIIGHRTSK